ncbi:MAG: ExbD/TolR family protein [Planctomycetota bacterium]|jgi:hypothetical protein
MNRFENQRPTSTAVLLAAVLCLAAASCRSGGETRYFKRHFPKPSDTEAPGDEVDLYVPPRLPMPTVKKLKSLVMVDPVVVELAADPADDSALVRIGGEILTLPDFEAHLRQATKDHRDAKEPRLSTRGLWIRADRSARFKHVQILLDICGKPGIGIHEIHLDHATTVERK